MGLGKVQIMPVNAQENIDVKVPIIIAHRGASGVYPEHSLEGYAKAIELGADYIEPDLVISKDGVLVARHDIYLSTTTDVASRPEFAHKERFVAQLGRKDWLVVDFTLAELKTLGVVQAREGRDKSHDGKYKIPTSAEIIELAKSHNQATGGNVGIYPETKQPKFYQQMGYDFAGLLMADLRTGGVANGELPVFIQSFDVAILHELAPVTQIPLIYLLENQPQGEATAEISKHASILSGIGPDKRMLMAAGTAPPAPSPLMLKAQQLGLKIHPWTFRDDDIGSDFKTAEDEYLAFFKLGIDGMFTDFTDTGVRTRQMFLDGQQQYSATKKVGN